MAKCLRCGATSEWIEGRVLNEPRDDEQSWQLAKARIDELEARLELEGTAGDGSKVKIDIGDCDGIGCRDETIKLLDARVEKLSKWRDELLVERDALARQVRELSEANLQRSFVADKPIAACRSALIDLDIAIQLGDIERARKAADEMAEALK